ncbi:MAG: hypothetical protein Q4C82_00970 [Eubacteriales bacterium]|nr:hypothetical protein [Eubacteriales bacterium]
MPLLTEKERQEELEHISELLNGLELPAEVMTAGGMFDQSSLLIGLPTEEDIDWDKPLEELPNDLHVAAGYLIQLDAESEDQLTKYFMLYAQVLVDLTGVDELEILRTVNQMNQEIALGTFFYADTTDLQGGVQGRRVQFRHSIGIPDDGEWDEGVLGETILEAGVYYDIMKERLTELLP